MLIIGVNYACLLVWIIVNSACRDKCPGYHFWAQKQTEHEGESVRQPW
jgi:hypothetical protein